MPTQKAVKRRAPSKPMTRAASRAKTKTVTVMTAKRARGMPERAICESKKDWQGSRLANFKLRKPTFTHRKQWLLGSKLVEFGPQLSAPLGWEKAVYEILALVDEPSDCALESSSHAPDKLGHGVRRAKVVRMQKDEYIMGYTEVWRR